MTTTNEAYPTYNNYKRAVGVFRTRRAAETALHKLKDSGYDMERVSVIVRNSEEDKLADADVHDDETVGNKADEGAAAGAVTGGVLGTAAGLLVGIGALTIPGIGPILLAGAEATALATTLAGTAIGAAAGGLLGALIGLGIPEERARIYSDRVARGEYLVMVTGTEASIARAEAILGAEGIEEWDIYDAPDLANQTTATAASTEVVETTDTPPIETTTATDGKKIYDDPEVIIIDKRNKTHPNL